MRNLFFDLSCREGEQSYPTTVFFLQISPRGQLIHTLPSPSAPIPQSPPSLLPLPISPILDLNGARPSKKTVHSGTKLVGENVYWQNKRPYYVKRQLIQHLFCLPFCDITCTHGIKLQSS